MLASPPASRSPPADFSFHGTDEECMLFLGRRKMSPLPPNMTTEVNPFSIEPWNASEKMWFLYDSVNLDISQGEKKIDVGNGYWKVTENDIKLFPGSLTEGRKITWEFHIGIAPSGYQTGWSMLEFKRETIENMQQSFHQDFVSLYTVCRCHTKLPIFEDEQHNSFEEDIEAKHLQSILFNIVEDENLHLPESASESEVVNKDEHHKLPHSTGQLDLEPNSAASLWPCDLSEGDFLELNDFDELESLSSSSDNSSHASRTFDEYFDSENLLQNQNNLSTKVDESIAICEEDIHGKIGSAVVDKDAHHLGRRDKDIGSTDSSSSVPALPKEHRGKRAASLSPQSSGSSHGSGTPITTRLVKLGKKYCCFAPH